MTAEAPATPAEPTTPAAPTTPAEPTTPTDEADPPSGDRDDRAERVHDGVGRLHAAASSAASTARGSLREMTFETPLPAIDTPYRLSAASIVRFWWVDDDELRAVRERAQDLQEAVDVEVVERGLDLVEDVERARPGEEDGEQERERGHRLLAAGEQRQALGRLARGRDLDLDAHLVVRAVADVLLVVGLGRRGSPRRPRRAAEDGARAGVLAHEPQVAAAAREEVADDLLEVLRRGGEGLLEGLLDAAVRVADQLLELPQRGLQVVALAFELLDVLERLLVLLLRERVDRAELVAAALQALDAGVQRRALVVGQRLVGRLGLQAELGRQAGELLLGVLGVVARPLRRDLAARDLLAALLEALVDARLLRRALAQLGGELVGGGAVGGELGLEDLEAGADDLARGLQRVARDGRRWA